MYSFSYLEPVCCSMSSSNCCFLTCIQISQEADQVVWYSHLFHNFPQFIVIHTVKGFGVVNKAEIDVFLKLSCFFHDPADVGNLISSSSAFPKTSLNIWKFIRRARSGRRRLPCPKLRAASGSRDENRRRKAHGRRPDSKPRTPCRGNPAQANIRPQAQRRRDRPRACARCRSAQGGRNRERSARRRNPRSARSRAGRADRSCRPPVPGRHASSRRPDRGSG